MIELNVILLLAVAFGGIYAAYKFKITALYLALAVLLIIAAAAVWTGGITTGEADV